MKLPADLRMIAWEITRSCNLNCIHCRAASQYGPYEGEYSTERCVSLLDEIAEVGHPVIILTGGEPYMRDDIFHVAAEGDRRGFRMVLATNGTLVTGETAERTKRAGIKRVSVSLDGPDAAGHDLFRGVSGAFKGALEGIEAFRRAGVEFQINTTITETNRNDLPRIMDLAVRLGAAAHHIFLLVPTGRARDMAHQAIGAAEYEETLTWFHEQTRTSTMPTTALTTVAALVMSRPIPRSSNSPGFHSRGTDVTRMAVAAPKIMKPSIPLDRYSAFPRPKWCRLSAGFAAERKAIRAMTAATTLTIDSIASESKPTEPVMT